MKIYKEISLKDFEFWAGAKSTVELITDDELENIEYILENDCGVDIWNETKINDLFWFDTEFIAEILGYEDFESFYNERKR